MSHATSAAQPWPLPSALIRPLTLTRFGAAAILAAALAVSYMHLVELAQAFGETGWRAYAIAGTVDTLIVLSVYAGRAAREAGTEAGRVVRWALSAGIGATLVGNVHHGIVTNLPAGAFENGLIRNALIHPTVDDVAIAQIAMGVVVALWAPAAAEIAYRLMLWAQDQEYTQHHAQPETTTISVSTVNEPDHTPDPDPTPGQDSDDDHDARPGPRPESDDTVVSFYRRSLASGRKLSERGLANAASEELGREVTRHEARKAIAAAKLASGQHRKPEPELREPELRELAAV